MNKKRIVELKLSRIARTLLQRVDSQFARGVVTLSSFERIPKFQWRFELQMRVAVGPRCSFTASKSVRRTFVVGLKDKI